MNVAMNTHTGLHHPLSIWFPTEHLNSDFIQFLLDVIEDGLSSDPTEQLPDLFINLVLAFNLHLTGEKRNTDMCG